MIYTSKNYYTDEAIAEFYDSLESKIERGYVPLRTIKSQYSNAFNIEFSSHEGRTIKVTTETKYYFDDDRPYEHTHAIVWSLDENGKRVYKNIPCMSSSFVDATPEDIALYNKHIEYVKREKRVLDRLYQNRTRYIKAARKAGYDNYHIIRKLHGGVGEEKFAAAVKLVEGFKNNKLRSEFRKSLAKQIVSWMEEKENKYRRPLSPRQLDYI